MTREQAKQFLVTVGVAEPTDEQITAYLNNVNGAVKAEKDKADALKKDADLAKELQGKLDAIEAEKLSDIEKANKETEKANAEIADLKKQMKQMQTMNKLAELGITGENAEKLIDANGEINFDVLGQVISEKEKSASELKEKELLDKTPNPSGALGGGEPEKTDAEKFAESYAKRVAESNKATSDAMASYLK